MKFKRKKSPDTKYSEKIFAKKQKQPQEVLKKGVLGNIAKLTEKHLCQSLFFNKVAGVRPET